MGPPVKRDPRPIEEVLLPEYHKAGKVWPGLTSVKIVFIFYYFNPIQYEWRSLRCL
jgi:hypothetical protein